VWLAHASEGMRPAGVDEEAPCVSY
jgi:hypothetical protein